MADTPARFPAARRKRYEEIAEHLELQIFSGRLLEGEKIPSERELMEQFGVGRSTVREALFSLQRKGLLSARAGAAARVTKPTPQTIVSDLSGAARHFLNQPNGARHLQHARALLEIGLTREVALRASDDDLSTLSEALEANRSAIEGSQKAFEHTDLMFHYTLAMIAHNPIFTSLNHALNEWLAEQRSMSARAGATRMEVYQQHKAVYDAILARDPVGAQAAMEVHLAAVYRNYWKALQPLETGTEY
ncbi:FCD domain-containing protein [Acidisoma sp. S159]|jgi:DNA-binding FadR family transcriptional regulator|uniref:FCD domain-containing protein n=1 Tax=Acidisoma sp. S159 TaxID=1747225 RepID=UPI00131DA8AF|nr:FCD domain-containing protein [Acidisoma sp. S159]